MKKILPIILVVVVVAGAVGAYFMFFRGEAPIVYSYFAPGDFFVTNVNESNHLFKVSIYLVLNTDKLEEELGTKQALIRDTIIFILREMTSEDIENLQRHESLRVEIATAVNERLGIENVVDVLFTDYVMQ